MRKASFFGGEAIVLRHVKAINEQHFGVDRRTAHFLNGAHFDLAVEVNVEQAHTVGWARVTCSRGWCAQGSMPYRALRVDVGTSSDDCPVEISEEFGVPGPLQPIDDIETAADPLSQKVFAEYALSLNPISEEILLVKIRQRIQFYSQNIY
jgi:hypothetical protein